MRTADEFKSALSAEQWRTTLKNFDYPIPTVEHLSDGEDILFRAFRGQLLMRDHEDQANYHFTGDKLAMLIALANHALPDDDPRKLTWEDSHAVREAWETLGGADPDSTLYRIAQKLAAFLPSSPPTDRGRRARGVE